MRFLDLLTVLGHAVNGSFFFTNCSYAGAQENHLSCFEATSARGPGRGATKNLGQREPRAGKGMQKRQGKAKCNSWQCREQRARTSKTCAHPTQRTQKQGTGTGMQGKHVDTSKVCKAAVLGKTMSEDVMLMEAGVSRNTSI